MAATALYNVIAGVSVEGRSTFDKVNPVDGSLVAQVHEAGPEIVDAAVRAARSALEGPWGRMTVSQRVALLRKVADRIDERFDDFVVAEVADTGKPVQLARDLDVARAAMNFRSFADTIANAGVDAYLTEFADGGKALNYAVNKPLGVVAVIV
ncbi:MAG: aldehyde dehydrogenase family protein, partial [Nakamurella sp.]